MAAIKALDPERALYNMLKRDSRYNGMNIQPSDLHLEAVLKNNQSGLIFQLRTDEGNPRPNEIRLDKTDLFVSHEMALLLAQQTTGSEEYCIWHSYPSDDLDDAAAVDIPQLYALYNGYLNIKVGDLNALTNMKMNRFLDIPENMKETVSAAAAGGDPPVITTYRNAQSPFDGHTGYRPLTPTISFSGASKTTISLTYGRGTLLAPTTEGLTNVAALCLRGFLITNGATIQGPSVMQNVQKKMRRMMPKPV